jgi:hypothetical protein
MELEGESPGVLRLGKEVSLPEKKPDKRRIKRREDAYKRDY